MRSQIKLQKIVGKNRYVSKIVHEWNDQLEIFSHPKAIEASRQYLLLRTDINFYRKPSLGAPAVYFEFCTKLLEVHS